MAKRYATINGKDVIAPLLSVAWKYADPTEGARWIRHMDEAKEIEREDPGLIEWVWEEVE